MNTNEIIVCPDIHGRSFWKKLLEDKTDRHIVFLGDYLDPYFYEFGSMDQEDICKQAISNFEEIIAFKNANPDWVTLLVGNHCVHYLGIAEDTCRMDTRNLPTIFKLFNENKNLFQVAYRWNNTLFTHAGVCTGWLKQRHYEDKITADNVEAYLNNLLLSVEWKVPTIGWSGCRDYTESPLTDIGRSRGGYAPYGGPMWADMYDMIEGTAFNGELIQIVGHTQQEGTGSVIHKDNFYCCDSRSLFVWNNETLKSF